MDDKPQNIQEKAREKSFQASPKPFIKTTLITIIVSAIIIIIGLIMIIKFYFAL